MENQERNEFSKESIVQQNGLQDRKNGVKLIKVYDRFACIYNPNCRQVHENSLECLEAHNVVNRKYNGFMSTATKSKIRKILSAWLLSTESYNSKHKSTNYKSMRKLTFATLTLSSEQCHSDKQIKREILIPFIQHLCRRFNLKHYFWKAEKQDNGNIHFHLIIDIYIQKEELQHFWNYFQNRLGYIDRYTEKTMKLNPPSTDIRAITSEGKIFDYVMKYVCKDEMGKLVDGRIWGCSDALKQIDVYNNVIDTDISATMSYLIDNNLAKVSENEHCTIIVFNDSIRKLIPSSLLVSIMQDYYYHLFRQLYFGLPFSEMNEIINDNYEPQTYADMKEYAIQLTINF